MTTTPTDPYLWLEDVDGERAMTWVTAENQKTVGELAADPRYAPFLAEATAIAENHDRLPYPRLIGNRVYNFWQDEAHVRGLWRQTSVADYLTDAPSWTPVLDLDALATAESANWVWHGADCDPWQRTRCLVQLSDGGEDAVTVREFDLTSNRFPARGFRFDKGKQSVAWATPDSVYIARDWGPGTLTRSGYPYVVKRLRRGDSPGQAVEVFRGAPTDVQVQPVTYRDGAGHVLTVIVRALSFFASEFYVPTADGTVRLALPQKCSLETLAAGQAVFQLKESWTHRSHTYPAGALIGLALDSLTTQAADPRPVVVWTPGPRQSVSEVAGTRTGLLLTYLDNVRGRAAFLSRNGRDRWSAAPLALPDNSAIELASVEPTGGSAFFTVTGFLQPVSLWEMPQPGATLTKVKSTPPLFSSDRLVVEQRSTASVDGTDIPYFIVHRADLKLDGNNPTILDAYGGFEVSMTPYYSGTRGKLWLERGGVYVLANIRGGGEFGPAWHEAGLKTRRQRIYDDFRSVAEDLIRRGVTSPRRLGIEGGSNGGLQVGVQMTQHPELWQAVDIAVPLLDMVRYESIAAGASWVGEYGSMSNPDEARFLTSISPYHQLKPGVAYPKALIWTTTKDDRVGPQHARKFAARLAELGVPYYYYEVIEGGHGAGANLKERAVTTTLQMVYFTRQLAD